MADETKKVDLNNPDWAGLCRDLDSIELPFAPVNEAKTVESNEAGKSEFPLSVDWHNNWFVPDGCHYNGKGILDFPVELKVTVYPNSNVHVVKGGFSYCLAGDNVYRRFYGKWKKINEAPTFSEDNWMDKTFAECALESYMTQFGSNGPIDLDLSYTLTLPLAYKDEHATLVYNYLGLKKFFEAANSSNALAQDH